jgi:hypothetical protein
VAEGLLAFVISFAPRLPDYDQWFDAVNRGYFRSAFLWGAPKVSNDQSQLDWFNVLFRLSALTRFEPLARSTAHGYICRSATTTLWVEGGICLHWRYAPSAREEKGGSEAGNLLL